MPMNFISDLLNDANLRRFCLRHAAKIYLLTLCVVGMSTASAVGVLYLGIDTLSRSGDALTVRVAENETKIARNERGVTRNAESVTTLTIDQSSATMRLAGVEAAADRVIASLEEIQEQNRISNLEILISVTEADYRRIKRITDSNAASPPTHLEIEALEEVERKLGAYQAELQSLRGF